jgi:hypothetical protein
VPDAVLRSSNKAVGHNEECTTFTRYQLIRVLAASRDKDYVPYANCVVIFNT